MSTELGERPGRKIEGRDFPALVEGEDFSNCRIEWCRGKSVEFRNCTFSSSLIRSCYFHKATFKSCDFTGASFVDSNFRRAKLISCDLKYAVLRGTQIEASQIVGNLPHWENAQRDLLRSARKNAEAMGDVEDVRQLLRAEMIASEEHWRSAYRGVTNYYREHYPGLGGRVGSFFRLWGVRVSRWFWGHGESPVRLLASFFLWVLGWAIYVDFKVQGLTLMDATVAVLSVILLGSHSATDHVTTLVSLVLAASRFIFFGLFVTLVVRRFARR